MAVPLGTLRSGQTLRGMFNLGTEAKDGTDFLSDGVSFFFPLTNTPTVNPVLAPGNSTANCPGVAGGSQQTPNASPGNLCVYVSAQSGEAGWCPSDSEGVPASLLEDRFSRLSVTHR